MKLSALLVLLMIFCVKALPMPKKNLSINAARKSILQREINLNQLNDGFKFLASILISEDNNFLVSPFFKNRCGGIYILLINKKFSSIVSQNLKKLGFYEYFELFATDKTSVLTAVDFVLTHNHDTDSENHKDYHLVKKGIIIGNGFLYENPKNKKYRDTIISKVLNSFKIKFGEGKLSYINYLSSQYNLNTTLKIVSVVNFKSAWESEFYDCSYHDFILNDGGLLRAKFMQSIGDFILVDNAYGKAFRLFYKNRHYALDIISTHDYQKSTNMFSIGYMIDLIMKLNKGQEQNLYTKYFAAIPKFEFRQFNNDITPYFQSSLLDGVSINKNVNFINILDGSMTSKISQDFSIKINKKGTNVEDTKPDFIEKSLDINKTAISNRILINRPFIFMINELNYEYNMVTIKNILALGKINDPVRIN